MTIRLLLPLLIVPLLLYTAAAAQEQPADLAALVAAAEPGSTLTLAPGRYAGPAVIDKALTVKAAEGVPGEIIIQGNGSGDVIRITAPDVTLSGLTVEGSGLSLDDEDSAIHVMAPRATLTNNLIRDALFGIYLANAPDSVVRGNVIIGKDLPISRKGDGLKIWYSANSLVEDNHIHNVRDVVIWFSPGTAVRNNLMENNRYGIHYMSTDDQIIEDNVLRGNSVGLYLMYGTRYILRHNLLIDNRGPSGYGLGLKEVSDVVLEDNRIINNRVGVYADNAPLRPDMPVIYRGNLFAFNEIGLALLPNVRHSQFTGNLFLDNGVQVEVEGGGQVMENEWAVAGRGNYWSDYTGYDADGDQIGDLPYESVSLYEDLLATYPELRLFRLSPATDALDLAAEAFPLFQPQPRMADPHPLTAPPALAPMDAIPQQPVTAALWTGLALIAVAAAILATGRLAFR